MNTPGVVPEHLQPVVDAELETGEHVRWIDSPVPRFFTCASTGAFLFAIPWTGFAIFWTCGAAGILPFGSSEETSGGKIFPLFGIPFILIGLGLLSSPLRAYRKVSKTVYVITDKRAISFVGGRTTTIRSYGPGDLQVIFRRERGNDTGDVVFESMVWRDSDGKGQTEEVGFINIRDVRSVERMLKDLAKQDKPGE